MDAVLIVTESCKVEVTVCMYVLITVSVSSFHRAFKAGDQKVRLCLNHWSHLRVTLVYFGMVCYWTGVTLIAFETSFNRCSHLASTVCYVTLCLHSSDSPVKLSQSPCTALAKHQWVANWDVCWMVCCEYCFLNPLWFILWCLAQSQTNTDAFSFTVKPLESYFPAWLQCKWYNSDMSCFVLSVAFSKAAVIPFQKSMCQLSRCSLAVHAFCSVRHLISETCQSNMTISPFWAFSFFTSSSILL